MYKPNINTTKKVLVIASLFISAWFFIAQVSLYQNARDNILYLQQVYLKISDKYVERVNMPLLINTAIKAMVNELDPYTEYIEKDAKRKVQMITEGTYGGLGMEIGMRDNNITIIAPIEDTPAERAGIHAGDQIYKIDNKNVKGLSLDKISKMLRGRIGTEVTIEIIRPGVEEAISLKMVRDKIVIKDVQYYSFVKPGVAYVKLSGFTEKAPTEFINAINELQKQDEIKAFLLDLRSNPGGLLASAVKISNIFIPKGKLVVSTKGAHEAEKKYKTFENPLLPDVPLVVLVDNGSASASEIVAGAIKDLDRGVIVGDTTYGKGLVQKLLPLDDSGNIQLKMTTAKYFTPSGRCIQRDEYKLEHKDVFMINNKDSLMQKKLFKTQNGRSVYSGGGIAPDVFIKNREIEPVIHFLWRKNILFDFAVKYLTANKDFQINNEYEISDDIITQFYSFLKERKIKYVSYEQNVLKKSIYKLEKREDLKNTVDLLNKELNSINKIDSLQITNNIDELKWAIKLELASQLEKKNLKLNIILKQDNQFESALKLIMNNEIYLTTLVRK